LQLHGLGLGGFACALPRLLHADLRLAAQLLPLAALHLGGGAVGVLGPKAVVVAGEFTVPFLQRFGVLRAQQPIDRPGGGRTVLAYLRVHLLAQPADGTADQRRVQRVQCVFYGNVAGKSPHIGVTPAAQPRMPENAVQNAVQVGPRQILTVLPI